MSLGLNQDLQSSLTVLYLFTAIKQAWQMSYFFLTSASHTSPFGFDVIYLKTNLTRDNGHIRCEELLYLIHPSVALEKGLGTTFL